MKPLMVGLLNVMVTKRQHNTPKEINQYLKDHKGKLTLQEITKSLGIPKTQTEHYFRTDKYRTIPSPEIWKKLKVLLNLDSKYDKMVLEFYQKEQEFEMTRRVWSDKGISPTIKTLEELNVLITPKKR